MYLDKDPIEPKKPEQHILSLDTFLDPKTSVLEKLETSQRALSNWQDVQLDKISGSVLDSVLDSIGKSVVKSGETYFARGPKELEVPVHDFFAGIWATAKPELRESIMGPVPGDYNAFLIQCWPEAFPPLFSRNQPQPYTWARAHINYALLPADRLLFPKMSNPLYLVIMGFKLYSYTAVPMFALQFFLLDQRDEYQLVSFILNFKSYQFLTGVYYAISLSFTFFDCLGSQSYELGEPRTCDSLLSVTKDGYAVILSMEVPRVMLIAIAVALLIFGYSSGGAGELKALAEVRIDVADGSLDGFADTVKVQNDMSATREDVTFGEIDRATEFARIKYGAKKSRGNYLPYFMVFDFATLGLATVYMLIGYEWRRHSLGIDVPRFEDPLLWISLYYLKLYYSLLAFPFLIFHVPVFGSALHGAKPTGYDKSGLLVPKLSSSHILKKERFEEERRKLQGKLEGIGSSTVGRLWLRARHAWRASYVRRLLRASVGVTAGAVVPPAKDLI